MKETLMIARYVDGQLIDGFEVEGKEGMRSLFEWAKRLPCAEQNVAFLEEGVLVLDLKEGDDVLEDPLIILSESADWFLFDFIKLDRRKVAAILEKTRQDGGVT